MKESCVESESKTEESDDLESYFNDESDTETINSVAPEEFLHNAASASVEFS